MGLSGMFYDVTGSGKSNMVVSATEVPKSQLVDKEERSFNVYMYVFRVQLVNGI